MKNSKRGRPRRRPQARTPAPAGGRPCPGPAPERAAQARPARRPAGMGLAFTPGVPLDSRPYGYLVASKTGAVIANDSDRDKPRYFYTLLTDLNNSAKQYVKIHRWSRNSANGRLQYEAKYYAYEPTAQANQ